MYVDQWEGDALTTSTQQETICLLSLVGNEVWGGNLQSNAMETSYLEQFRARKHYQIFFKLMYSLYTFIFYDFKVNILIDNLKRWIECI